MLTHEILIYTGLILAGLSLGSFAGASVYRLRARQLVEDKKAGEKVDAKELKRLKPLSEVSARRDRSRCLHCGHTLAWYDLLPLGSWLSLKGKCRYCKQSIGRFEPVIELSMMAVFVLSYALWPFELSTPLAVTQFMLWLASSVGLAILFVYDLRWFLLPNSVMFTVIGIAAASAVVTVLQSSDAISTIWSITGAVGILSGLYLILYLVSKGQWVGFGDIKLGLALALLLADWQLAFVALFAANLIGTAIVIPGMIRKKLTRKTQVPFGPLLIAGFLIALLFGFDIINWYMSNLV